MKCTSFPPSAPAVQRLDEWHRYLPISPSLMRTSFYVTSVGRISVRPGETYPPPCHPWLYHFSLQNGRILPEFGLILITEGRGKFESEETGEIDIVAGQAILLCANVWHRYHPDSDSGWTEKWILFDGTTALQMLEQRILSPHRPVFNPPNFRTTENQLDHLLDIIRRTPTANTALLSVDALSVIASVVRDTPISSLRFRVEDCDHPDAMVVAALDYIWTQGRNVLNVPEVASAVGVTRRTLERHTVTTLGHGILEEIINCRFSRAERLLRSTRFPLKVIVNLAGFGSMENMRQVFVTRTKMSPLAYRHSHCPPQYRAA